jgi:hypothetical protein
MTRITDTEIAKSLKDDIIVNKKQMCICDGLTSSENTNMGMKVELFKNTGNGNKREFVVAYIIFDANNHSVELQEVLDTNKGIDFTDVLTLNVWFGQGEHSNIWTKLAEYLKNHFPTLDGYECLQLNLAQIDIKDIEKFKNEFRRNEISDILRYTFLQNAINCCSFQNMFKSCTSLSQVPQLPNNISAL